MVWPPRSPYLTPIDFSLWGHIKALIYTTPVDSEEDLLAPIVEAAATIRQQPGTLGHIQLSVLCCCLLYIEDSGHTFEHLLYIGMKYNFLMENTSMVSLDGEVCKRIR